MKIDRDNIYIAYIASPFDRPASERLLVFANHTDIPEHYPAHFQGRSLSSMEQVSPVFQYTNTCYIQSKPDERLSARQICCNEIKTYEDQWNTTKVKLKEIQSTNFQQHLMHKKLTYRREAFENLIR
ncbi:hypothetical protein [Endozoicomonas sp.]|uniref:hypothetical protein n=1 Tax=Endozoicomonas sp. TaxID=1892382 RepID=UPI002883FBC9|nr:hypothetical protein [Endozoicomonas sp.]